MSKKKIFTVYKLNYYMKIRYSYVKQNLYKNALMKHFTNFVSTLNKRYTCNNRYHTIHSYVMRPTTT